MCKNSVYLVKNNVFIHNFSTLDEWTIINNVEKDELSNIYSATYQNLIHVVFSFYKSIYNAFTRFPHKLLLLLLSIKLNIINKTVKKWSFK